MHERSFVARYGIAIAACAAALALRAALGPWLGDRFPFIFLYPAVALAAWLGGLGPAMLVTVSGTSGVVLIVDPVPPSDPALARVAHWIGATIFVGAATCIGLLGEQARRSTSRAARSEREKDDALRELASSERLYRAAGELIPFGIWVADARGRATYLSRSFQDMLGVEFRPGSDEWALRIDAADYEAAITAWQRAVDTSAPSFEHEFRVRDKDGQTRCVLARGAPLRDGQTGAITSWVGVHFDVTERRRAEREMARLVAIVESSDDAIISHSPDGAIVSFNPGAERMYGYQAADVIGQHLSVLLPPDRADEVPELMQRLRRGERIDHYETVRRRKDGTLIDVSISISPLRDSAGRLIGASKIARDVTADRRAARVLRESEERFHMLADSAPVLIWVNGLEGCEFVNRSYASFVGMSVDEVRGMGWTRAVHAEDLDEYLRAYRAAFGARATFEAQVRLRGAADGEYRWHQSVGHPRLTGDGSFLGYVGCSFDIEQIKQSEAALREADRRKDDFLAMLGHELRNPLAPIRNAVGVLGSAGSAHEREWARDVIERQVRHLTRLVDDLLDVSRITRGKITLRAARVRLTDAVNLAVETVRPLAEERGQTLVVALPPGDHGQHLFVHGDEARLAQVFQNLLHNATKFTPAGGHVRVAVERDGGDASVRVCDDGCGITPELLASVFEPFAQADRSLDRAGGGLGIGLTLVKTLVEMHGGRVEARSAGAGRGSEFVVRLPISPEPAARAEPMRPPARDDRALAPVPGGGANGEAVRRIGPLRVLVVDDNLDSARSMSLLLKLWGHESEVAPDGPAAIERAAALRPHVVLLDIGLPGMSGYDVARELRCRPESRGAMIVAVTGYGRSEDRQRSAAAGFDHHLVKPVDPSAVERLLDEACAASPSGAEAPAGARDGI